MVYVGLIALNLDFIFNQNIFVVFAIHYKISNIFFYKSINVYLSHRLLQNI